MVEVPAWWKSRLRTAARAAGETFYHGRMCKRHGTTLKSVSRGACVRCTKAKNAAWSSKNKAKLAAKQRKRRTRIPDLVRAYDRARQRDKYLSEDPAVRLARQARWRRNYAHVAAGIKARRRARRYNAVPPWLTSEHRKEMAALYALARQLKLTVDHIIPLAGCRSCGAQGLEVPWNLRLMEEPDNKSKWRYCDQCIPPTRRAAWLAQDHHELVRR